MTITTNQQAAITQFAQSFVDLTESFGIAIPAKTAGKPKATKRAASPKKYSAVDANTLPAVREDRRRLILAAIDAAGGTVTVEEWRDITALYGYDSRRLGGFFAKRNGTGNGAGMVEMSEDRTTVRLTEHGKTRL